MSQTVTAITRKAQPGGFGKSDRVSGELDTIDDILADVAAGRMVVIMDAEDRENEGDLVMAATHVRPEDINFMAHHARGLICLTLTQERCLALRLPLMVDKAGGGTNFTLSIEAAEGVTTGISAYDRAHTVQTAVAADAQPESLRQPGHVFPVMAEPGGVLSRDGHTEAGCDLARLAGLEPAAVIVEILNEDGTMARLPDLKEFAKRHGLKIGTIADLIRYRLEKEKFVERIGDYELPTDTGDFRLHCYEDHVNRNVHLALVHGEISADTPTLVRVHLQDTLGDVLGGSAPELGWPLKNAMRRVVDEGSGVIVVLRNREEPRDLIDTLNALGGDGDEHADGDDAAVLRTYGVGAQILHDLGVRKMRVMSAPKQMRAISGFGLEIVEYID